MSLSEKTKEVLLSNLYYSPNTLFTSIKSLYDAVKSKKITYNEVKQFIQKQDSNQLFKKQPKIKNYFPVYSEHKYDALQLYVADMSNLATANKNYKYLLVAIDVYSRLAFVVPMKNKTATTVNTALIEILDHTEPNSITTDQGSEFINAAFKKILTNRGIDVNYVDVGSHHALGTIDRYVRTLREKINKYMEMYNTTTYIDVLQKIVENYNLAYHSGIKKAPVDVKDDDKDVNDIFLKKYMKAKEEEVIFNIGDNVRYILNFKQFEKHTLPKWSVIHKIIDKNVHSYKLDNGKFYKYYELQKVSDIQKLNEPIKGPTREQMSKERSTKRKFKLTGLDLNNIISTKRQP